MSCYLDGYYLILRREGDQTAVIFADGPGGEGGQQQLYSSESEEMARAFASGVLSAIRIGVVDEITIRTQGEELAFRQGRDAACLVGYLAEHYLTPGSEEARRVARGEEAPRQKRAPKRARGVGRKRRETVGDLL